jgi:hypothetical protein
LIPGSNKSIKFIDYFDSSVNSGFEKKISTSFPLAIQVYVWIKVGILLIPELRYYDFVKWAIP